MIRYAFLIFSLFITLAVYAQLAANDPIKTVPYVMVNDDGNYWIIGNGLIQRDITLSGNTLFTVSLYNKITGEEYARSTNQGDFVNITGINKKQLPEFALIVNGVDIAPNLKYESYSKQRPTENTMVLNIVFSCTAQGIQIVCTYTISAGEPFIAKHLEIINTSTLPVELKTPVIHEQLLLDANKNPRNRLVLDKTGKKAGLGNINPQSPLVICENKHAQTGFFMACNGSISNQQIRCFKNYSPLQQWEWAVPQLKSNLKKGDTLHSPKAYVGVYSDKQVFNKHLATSYFTNKLTPGNRQLRPLIFAYLNRALPPIDNFKTDIATLKKMGFETLLMASNAPFINDYKQVVANGEMNLALHFKVYASDSGNNLSLLNTQLENANCYMVYLEFERNTDNNQAALLMNNLRLNFPDVHIMAEFKEKQNIDFGLLEKTDMYCLGTMPDFNKQSIGRLALRDLMCRNAFMNAAGRLFVNGIQVHQSNIDETFALGLMSSMVFSGKPNTLSSLQTDSLKKWIDWYKNLPGQLDSVAAYIPVEHQQIDGFMRLNAQGNGYLVVFNNQQYVLNTSELNLPSGNYQFIPVHSKLKTLNYNTGKNIDIPLNKQSTVSIFEIQKISSL